VGALRFFVSGVFEIGERARLDAGDARKLTVVLRKRDGAEIEIVDSSGRIYAATLRLDADRGFASLDRVLSAPSPMSLRITLAQAVPKGQKMDYVVEKATELGLERVVAFTSSRTLGDADRAGKLERWRRLAKSAAQQCGRTDIPAIEGPLDIEALACTVPSYDVALVPWELAQSPPLRERLPELLAGAHSALVVIGPEGGLSRGEAHLLESSGAHLITLGPRILRTETAGLVACTTLLYATGNL
jgi:16S rRNA (uracil1498-N3)-methyltransferase